jgi:hypothetical protein
MGGANREISRPDPARKIFNRTLPKKFQSLTRKQAGYVVNAGKALAMH